MNRSLRKFVAISVGLHLILFILSGFVAVAPGEGSAAPIRVTLIPPPLPEPELDQAFMKGKVEDLPEKENQETPDVADILSRSDSRAHAPDKGKKYQGTATAIPRERIDPTPPAQRPDEVDSPAKAPTPVDVKVAALMRPDKPDDKAMAVKDLDLFSQESIRRAVEAADKRRIEEAKEKEKEKSRKPTTVVTDRPAPPRPEAERPTGSDLKGDDEADYLMSDTGDVVDMGDEAVVSLNTRAFEYVDYFSGIKKKVERVWSYPEEAILSGASGRVVVRFTLSADGKLQGVKVVRSSGHTALDKESLRAINRGGPYAPFPPNLEKKRLHVVASFVYRPSYSAFR